MLNASSAAAIARLRAYRAPPSQYSSLPLTRRAAVLILLFADRGGDLKVVLTMRASTLKSYAGQAALPGGKADSLSETPWETARREAYEEIGLPLDNAKLPYPFRLEHLCQLPANLAKTELGVRPCVAFLSASQSVSLSTSAIPAVETSLIPKLDAKEVAAVFTAPFHNFLSKTDELKHETAPAADFPGVEAAGFPSEWYKGVWTDWHESRWRMHNFYVPIVGQTVTKPRPRAKAAHHPSSTQASKADEARSEEDPLEGLTRFRVFGMTARILVDAARVAYDEEPDFEHNAHFGDEDMIARLLRIGRLSEKRRPGDELTRNVMKEAAKI